jgi:phospholipase C
MTHVSCGTIAPLCTLANGLAFAGIGTLLTLVAVGASFIPARREMRVDPIVPDTAGFAPSGGADNHNVGDLLNNKGVTWGWFQGGFTPTSAVNGVVQCGSTTIGHPGILGNPSDPIHNPIQSYVPHHNPFMYYQRMANSHHLPPTSAAMVGKTDQAMHQYDLTWFFDAVDHHRMPAVSFLKAAKAMDGHPGSTNSDPLSEQLFIVDVINHLQRSSEWKDTVVIIAYDDADGWYDHVNGPIVNHSNVAGADVLNGGVNCGTPAPGAYLGRCGYGARLPFLVISPWAKRNFVDHTTTDQTSIIRFIEDNGQLGRIDDLDHPGGTPPGQGSFDQLAGTLLNMLDFQRDPDLRPYILDHFTGQPVAVDETEKELNGEALPPVGRVRFTWLIATATTVTTRSDDSIAFGRVSRQEKFCTL